MKRFRSLGLTSFLAAMLLAATIQAQQKIAFQQSAIVLPDSATAAGIIGQSDNYTRSLTQFDLQGRLQSTGKKTEQEYLSYATTQVRTWSAAEQAQIREGFSQIAQFFKANGITLNLPTQIQFIKSTCKEEFGAEGYTRGNFIVINTGPEGLPASLIAHELFHVYSRHNEAVRDKLYAIIGFTPCKRVNYLAAIENRPITNPDCPVVEHYTTLNGEDMALILYSPKPYTGGNVFEQYLHVGLIALEGKGMDKKPKLNDGKGVVYDLETKPEILQKTGGNTPYILHPEEVCAEHFSMLVTGKQVASPEYLEKMKLVLKARK